MTGTMRQVINKRDILKGHSTNRQILPKFTPIKIIVTKQISRQIFPKFTPIKTIVTRQISRKISSIEEEKTTFRKLLKKEKTKKCLTNSIVVKAIDIRPLDITKGLMVPKEMMEGTICDPNLYPYGFILKLPKSVIVDASIDKDEGIEISEMFIPIADTRKYWQHSNGMYSVDSVGRALNFIIYCTHTKPELLESAVNSYFKMLTQTLSTKKGELAQLGMSIRYPHSAKATATVTDTLPPNTVQIHTTMAAQLGVKTGDVVLVERFPCLGFMSVRPQYVDVTDDEQCRFVIRSSKNYLCSMNLDFDGDVIYIASFKTEAANNQLKIQLMREERAYTNTIIDKMNSKKEPQILDGGFDICKVVTFPTLTKEEHHKVVKRATGVKAHTGPVIALSYNLMRLVEGCIPLEETKTHADIEVLLDCLGNSVFSQKHGIRSLQEEATDAICTANSEKMFELGFDKDSSKLLCNIIKEEAKKILQITNLVSFHKNAKEKGRSNIISKLIKEKHKLYFASRSVLKPYDLYKCTKHNGNDIPSFLFKHFMSDKPPL